MYDSQRAASIIVPFAAVLVQDRGRYLLVEEANPEFRHTWYLPAGHVDPGEGVAEAAIRETREESGIEIELLGLLSIDRNPADLETPRERWRFTFVGRPIGGELKTIPDNESLQAQWFPPEAIPALNLRNPILLERIRLHQSNPPLLPIAHFMRLGW